MDESDIPPKDLIQRSLLELARVTTALTGPISPNSRVQISNHKCFAFNQTVSDVMVDII